MVLSIITQRQIEMLPESSGCSNLICKRSIEPFKKRSLLELLATLEDIDEDFPNVDEGLVPLDNIQF